MVLCRCWAWLPQLIKRVAITLDAEINPGFHDNKHEVGIAAHPTPIIFVKQHYP